MAAIPVALAHLPVLGAVAVPWITPRMPGNRFVLGVVDAARQEHALRQRLCGVCGRPHGPRMVALARERDLQRRLSAEPPLNPWCAAYTARVCPAVNGHLQQYRSTQRPDPGPIPVPGGLGRWVHHPEDAAARRGAPIEAWSAVWLTTYDIVHDPQTRSLAASWREATPLRIRPLTGARTTTGQGGDQPEAPDRQQAPAPQPVRRHSQEGQPHA